ncbi:MAG: hypothetical protein C4522_10100 [Desulfobacteraceae bacterium]|nr:MAG: hypothetical protein C4522_10100 [Desulfobacteraceae bacterium]
MKEKKIFLAIILLFGMTACSQMIKPTEKEIYEQYGTIHELNQAILTARSNAADLYAPKGFTNAQNALNEAIVLAQAEEKEKALAVSAEGLNTIRQAEENTLRAKKIMWEVSDLRQRAIKAGASSVSKESFDDAETKFQKTNALIETGNAEKAKENTPDLLRAYSDLEKIALEKGVIELAQLAFEQAKELEAEKYAPQYFDKAKKELNLALEILETDRTRTEKANEHARLASKWAKNAGQISELSKSFTLRNFSYEDTVVWYWQQLELINEPFQDTIDFEQPNHIVIQSLQTKISTLKEDLRKISMESQLLARKQQDFIAQLQENHKKELSELNSTLTARQQDQDAKDRAERENRQKFIYTQSLFRPDEAQVFRTGDNILISANGFYFASGEDEIQASNFALLNKLLGSINQFPNAKVVISGHTDATGTAELNMALSERRAKNVADFIVNVGKISPENVTFKGYGDTKPIAGNKTKEGRDQNRRIEVMIVNE